MSSKKKTARLAGLIYLVLAITAIYGFLYVPSQIMVQGDVAATSDNILANELLFRSGIVSYLISQILVYQALSNEPHRQSYFSSDQGGKTGVMPKHNEDFSNAEQKEKDKFMGVRI